MPCCGNICQIWRWCSKANHNHYNWEMNEWSFSNPHLSFMWFVRSMMTSSNENISRVTGHLCGEFTGDRVTGHLCGEFTGPRWIPLTKASDAEFDVFFDLRLNKRLSKQSWGWWFEALSRPLWRHFNVDRSISFSAVICVVGYLLCFAFGTDLMNQKEALLWRSPSLGCLQSSFASSVKRSTIRHMHRVSADTLRKKIWV